jgi:Protein of unknown function (DUF4238)
MSEPIRHHFVTKAYLEGFVPDDGSRLHVYTRNKTDFFRAYPVNIAKIKNYYSLKGPDGTVDNKVETMLATNVEGPGIAVIKRLNAGHYDISATARAKLAFLMAIQEYRVPWMRETMEGAMKSVQESVMSLMIERPGFLEQSIAEFKEKEEKETLVTADGIRAAFRSGQITLADNPGASLWAMGSVATKVTQCYYEMKWTILESKTVPFVTSDCPVHRFYAQVQPERPYTGLADDRIQVRFPLSKSRMLIMEHDLKRMEIWHKLIARGLDKVAETRRMAASQIRRREADAAEVANLNAHTISMAARFAMTPVEMAEIPALFQGECQNIRQKVDHLPGGLIRMQTVYPARKA